MAWWNPFKRKSLDGTLEIFRELYGAQLTKSGAAVDWKTALQVTSVFACTRVVGEGVSQVPLKLFQETGKTRLPAVDHPLYNVLHRRPNPWMTSFEYRETMMLHLILTGNHYSFISRLGDRIIELVPFEPQCVSVERDKAGVITYKVSLNDKVQIFPAESIWHIKGPSWSGWFGLEAVKLAREAIGLSLSTEEHHAKMHANGAKPGGIISVDGALDAAQYKGLAKWVSDNFTGSEKAFNTMILDRGAKWFSTAMTGVDSQHLETRRYQVEEVCRALRVMPIMVGYSDKSSTYASAEQMFLAHVVHTLAPWYERIEQSINAHLLTDADAKNGVYAKFVEEGLLRGALVDTAETLSKYTLSGIMTRNEARSKLDMNPEDGLDAPLTPANSLIDGKLPEDPNPKPAPVVDNGKSAALVVEAFKSEVGRVIENSSADRRLICMALDTQIKAMPRDRTDEILNSEEKTRQEMRAFIEEVQAERASSREQLAQMVEQMAASNAAFTNAMTIAFGGFVDHMARMHKEMMSVEQIREVIATDDDGAATKVRVTNIVH